MIKLSALWMILWAFIMGLYNGVLKPFGINHHDYFYVSSFYFLICAGLSFFLFKVNPKAVYSSHIRPFGFSFLFVILFYFVGGFIIDWSFPIEPLSLAKFTAKGFMFPKLSQNVLTTKFFDVLCQQVLILIYINRALKLSREKQVIKIFTISFALLHLPLVFFLGKSSWYLTIPSFLAGFLFGHFQVKKERGVLYSLAIHLLFYLILGLFLRINGPYKI